MNFGENDKAFSMSLRQIQLIGIVASGFVVSFEFENDVLTLPNGFNLVAPIPESSTWAMLLIGFAGLGFIAYPRRKQSAALDASLAVKRR
jgi:hypothetical protein